MRISKFSEIQISQILREVQGGVAIAEVASRHNVSAATIYQWRTKYGGIGAPEMQRLRELKQDNFRLKRMHADLVEECAMLKEALQKKF